MDTWDAVTSRRNVRHFTDSPVEPAHLQKILEAGRRSPSASNRQPWDFVVVQERARLEQLAGVWQGAWHVAGAAAAIAVVAPEPANEREEQILYFDLGQATITMMVMAADLGIGTGHAAVADQELARSLLGHPADHFCANIISVGYS
ncbi:MAG: nitroreductase family protein, partial [Acidimicrobiia bacterium]